MISINHIKCKNIINCLNIILGGANGDVVAVHGEITNLDKLENFKNNVHNGEKDKVTVTTYYTIEGDAIIYTLNFNGKTIEYAVDMRRDKYAVKSDRVIKRYSFTNIVKESDKDITTYFLTDDNKSNRMDVLMVNTSSEN
ncbi:MAG: DUF4362 domain-containing protein [Clostridiaceae bacterium]